MYDAIVRIYTFLLYHTHNTNITLSIRSNLLNSHTEKHYIQLHGHGQYRNVMNLKITHPKFGAAKSLVNKLVI